MSATVVLQALGLQLQPNQLDPQVTPPGSLTEATNTIIKRDGVIESRRGYQLYGEPFGEPTDRAKQLAVYKNRILRHFQSTLQYDTGMQDTQGNEVFDDFAGSYTEPQVGRRIRYVEANSNFYFTTNEGIGKISATSASDFTQAAGYITQAGGINAVDLTATLDVTTGDEGGFLEQDAGVEYRVLWNTIDANNNLIYGAPSAPVTVYNPLNNLLLRDFLNVLGALDDTANNTAFPSMITFNQWVATYGLPSDATPIQLQAELINVATELDEQLLYADQNNVAPLQISGASINGDVAAIAFTTTSEPPTDYLSSGQLINLAGFTTATGTINGEQTISSVFDTFTTTGNTTTGQVQITQVVIGADYAGSLAGAYWTINSANNTDQYYVWYQVSGSGNDPLLAGKTGIEVMITTGNDAATVASATSAAILAATSDFTIVRSNTTYMISDITVGNPTTVTTTEPHGLATGDTITIAGSNSTPSINGSQTVTVTNPYQFTVPVHVTVAGNAGTFTVDNTLTLTNTAVGPAISATSGTATFPTTTTQTGVANNVITNLANTSGIFVGALVTGTGIPVDTYVTAIGQYGANTATISNGVNVNNTGVTFTFGPGITFIPVTTSTGPVTTLNATINSYTFTAIPQPGVPSSPATDAQLLALQTYLQQIITDLQSLPSTGTPPPISANSQALYIEELAITTTADVTLRITIPQGVTTADFFQIYRSQQAIATGPSVLQTDVVPNDELQQVYEAYPTAADIANGYIVVVDSTPDAFLGAYLYTNEVNGTGILSANQVPPVCLDMNYFKNCMFYANTRNMHQLTINLLGVQNIIEDYNEGNNPAIMITNGTTTNTYYFIPGLPEVTTVLTTDSSTLSSSGAASYFLINSGQNQTQYYVWYALGTSTDPAVPGATGIRVALNTGDNAVIVAQKTAYTLQRFNFDFDISYITDTITAISASNPTVITCDNHGLSTGEYVLISNSNSTPNVNGEYQVTVVDANNFTIPVNVTVAGTAGTFITNSLVIAATEDGITTPSSPGTTTFTITQTQEGQGQDAETNSILLSTSVSPAEAVDQTARSLVQVINEDMEESVNAYYLSSSTSPPGQISLQARTFTTAPFYVVASDALVGTSFSPDLSPDAHINSITATSPPVITTTSATGLSNLEQVLIVDSNSTPSVDGLWTATVPTIIITSVSATNPALVTTLTPHGLSTGQVITIIGSNSTPNINGQQTVTVSGANTFTIPVNVTVAGTSGSFFSLNSFTIPAIVTNAGTSGAMRTVTGAVVSDNQVLPNRIYYSQYLEPEGVPLVNTIDVGGKDKAILRIFPLRDSLFVFKEDGLYRISGEVAPFNLALFDSSVELIAPDSVDVSNNLVFAWTTKGIHTISEAGTNIISRPIDTIILPLATSQYTNFDSATWGIGYESDNSYTVYTVTDTTDVYATTAYRYSTLTNTWTTFDKTDNCGVINPFDDLQYLGAGDTNYTEQERKTFTRYDYADREIDINLTSNSYFGTQLLFTGITDVNVGDVLLQNQYVTVYDYNILLQKMDNDATLTHDYVANLELDPGLDLRTAVDALINQLANDTTRLAQAGALPAIDYTVYETIATESTITSISAANPTVVTTLSPHGLQNGRVITIANSNSVPSIDGMYQVTVIDAYNFTIPVNVVAPGISGTFTVDNESFLDIQTSYNGMINLMNTDPGVTFHNYNTVDMITVQEAIITQVNQINNVNTTLYVNLALDFVQGPLIVYNSIPVTVTWAPQTLNDPLGLKHMREATMMFENKAFTTASMNFATDLLPSYISVPIIGDGNGIFGYTGFGTQMPNNNSGGLGFGGGFFGGASNSAPFRTYIPRNCQRCRYLSCQFQHSVAREIFSIFGISLTGEISQSTRAYR